MPGPSNQNGNGEQALQRLLVSLDQVQRKVDGTEDDYLFLINVLQNRELRALVQVHSCISKDGKEQLHPVAMCSLALVEDVLGIIHEKDHIPEVVELYELLLSPHIQAILTAHDQVAQKDYFPKLPDIPHEVDEDEETVKIVQLVKSNEPLGATIKIDARTGTIVIARVMHGGAADRSGLIQVGDEVHEVNGINVRGKTPADVLQILVDIFSI